MEKKTGRPSKYSKTIVKNILERLARGESIRSATESENITWPTWRAWLVKDEDLRTKYAQAKQDGIDYTFDDVQTVTRDAIDKATNKQMDMASIKALDIWTKHKQFKASKLQPKVYGSDKQQLSLTNSNGQTLSIEWEK